MSEVTAKDLRGIIERFQKDCHYAESLEGKQELAAFDAMAEKATGFEKLRILLEQYQYIGLANPSEEL